MTLNAKIRALGSALSTGVLVVCAVVVTTLLVRKELDLSPADASVRLGPVAQPDWLSFAEVGNRVGPLGASAVLVAFTDYQCPACRAFERTVREARSRFPDDFAVVYRHLPLTDLHRFAESAALASECAGMQGSFETMHSLLFELRDSLGVLPWTRVARRASVADLREFDGCLVDSSAAGAIRRDIAAAGRLGARGTPTVLIAGLKYDGGVSIDALDSLIRRAIREDARK